MSAPAQVRLSELVASPSLATDIGMGQPMDHALRTCLLSVGIARELGLSKQECTDVYYLALLRFVGCNAHAHGDAEFSGGDEMAWRAGVAPVLTGEMQEFMAHMFKHLGEGLPVGARAKLVARALASGPKGAQETVASTCEVAQMLASRLGLGESLVSALGYTFEYWNGKGMPKRAKGEEIPLSVRIAAVARDVDVFNRIGVREVAEHILRKRRGRAYDPRVTEVFLEHAWKFLEKIDERSVWEEVIAADPSESPTLSGPRLDDALRCLADFADLKCAYSRGHSPKVSEFASAAARVLGLSASEIDVVRRAGLVQEIGKTGISNGILDKAAALTPSEWERVRLHPYLTERILARCEALSSVSALAGAHHERTDGSGYHRGSRGSQIPMGARILAVADAYRAMTIERPWRAAHSDEQTARLLRDEASKGRLDPEAFQAILAAVGQKVAPARRSWPAGLSDREVEVLRLISLGRSNREAAEKLVISPKTVGRHIENIYGKIGVSTRAGAAVFAMQHDLLID